MTTQCPTHTPWGRADHTRELAPGIWLANTPSHGGIWVSPDLYATMPEYLKQTAYSKGGWFEEDCDWAIPYMFFWDRLKATESALTHKCAVDTMKGWHLSKYDRYLQEKCA